MRSLARLCLAVLVAVCAAPLAQAQTPTPTSLYTPDVYIYPSLLGTDGNLYGTGQAGMFEFNLTTYAFSTVNADMGQATLCSIAPNGSFLALNETSAEYVTMAGVAKTLVTLPYDGSVCPVLADDGNYYGGNNTGGSYGDGYLYQLTPAGKVTVLYNFTGGTDGDGPATPMLQASDGNLYGVDAGGEMFRFSAADGLTAYSTAAGLNGPLFETSSGSFSAIQGYYNEPLYYDTITPAGNVTAVALDLNNDPDVINHYNGNVFLGGDGYLYLEEYYEYSNLSNGCEDGNFVNVYSLSPGAGGTQLAYSLGEDQTGNLDSSTFTLNEFVAGNGVFYGGYSNNYVYYGEDEECDQYGTAYSVFSVPAATAMAPIAIAVSANHIQPGGSTTVSWNATSAFADSLQQCYGYNGLSGKLPVSGSQKLTFAQAGTYTPAIVCGGVQTGIAPSVFAGSTQLALGASSNAVIVGQSVTLTASIENLGTPQPTGSVQFIYAGKVLATSTVSLLGKATLTASTTGLSTGSYSITAKYLGNSNYTAATSNAVSVTVLPLATTMTTLTTSTPTLVGGQTASFSVSVSNAGVTYPPTGTVTLYFGTMALLSGTLSGAVATLSPSTAGVAPGSYPITAKYSGDAYNLPSDSSAVTVVVAKGVTISVSATPNPVPAGGNFVLTARVTGNSSTPTGTVIFSAGSQELSGANLMNGVATANIPADTLAAGTYSITAAYAGDSKNPSGTSSPYSLTVQ